LDFDESHTYYDIVSKITDQCTYYDRCNIYTELSS